MKRNLFIIFVLSFILFGIDVNAASEEELNNYVNLEIFDDETICVFSPNAASKFGEYLIDARGVQVDSYIDNLYYIVIGINKNQGEGENVYDLYDHTFERSEYKYTTKIHHIIADEVPELASEGIVNSNNCSNYIVQLVQERDLNNNRPIFDIFLSSIPKDGINNNIIERYFEYNESKTNLVRSKVKINQSQSQCEFKFDNERYELSPYDKTNHYFRTTIDNSNICPAKVENYNFTRLYGEFNIDSFNCEEWKLASNENFWGGGGWNPDPDCRFYLVDVNADIKDKQDTTVEIQGTYITKYLSNQSSNADVITITNVNGTLRAINKNNKKEETITVSNIDSYTSTFLNKDEANYPTYITCNGTDCKFSNNKKDGKRAYIAMVKISTVLVGKEIAIEKCRDLFGSDFLEFLNNNVFKIVYIAIPILLIVLTSFDFAKVVFIDDKEGIQGSFKKFGKRAIVAVLIYLIPTILIFVSNIF